MISTSVRTKSEGFRSGATGPEPRPTVLYRLVGVNVAMIQVNLIYDAQVDDFFFDFRPPFFEFASSPTFGQFSSHTRHASSIHAAMENLIAAASSSAVPVSQLQEFFENFTRHFFTLIGRMGEASGL